ncbi:MAG: NAD(P)H-binding protein, partial [Alphaproteobacteria bacterium]
MARAAVFGATGFLGGRVVDALAGAGIETIAAARRPDASGERDGVVRIAADVTEPASLPLALRKVDVVVNCVGCYRERAGRTFADVHVEGARNLAEAARTAGAARLIHLSGIGADAASGSPYIRARGQGEHAVRASFPDATLIRPSMMFGPGGDALEAMAAMLRASPVFPVFGAGRMRLQPV